MPYRLPTYTRLVEDEEMSLYSLEHIYSMCSTFLSNGMEKTQATFDLVIRDLPPHRNFLLAGGLEAVIQYVLNLKYSKDQIDYLLSQKRISKDFAKYLQKFKFSGDIMAMPEGTIYFPGEPMIRVTAPIIEANLITDALMALVTVDTTLLSKMVRVKIAAQDKFVGTGFVRAQGIDAGWRAGRSAYFFENMGVSCAALAKRMGVTPGIVVVAHHAYIKSFPDELTAMRAITKDFPTVASLMIDTYDVKQGIANAIIVANELKEKGKKLAGIVIDSGDVLEISKYARKELNKSGHRDTTITITGNLDEHKVAHLIKQKAPADKFLVVTEVITSPDAPKLETVYKNAELRNGNTVRYTAKFAKGKLSLPGRKQVFRIFDSKGKIKSDIIGFENERYGKPLLIAYIKKGKLVRKLPSLEEIRTYVSKQINTLPNRLLSLEKTSTITPKISKKVIVVLEQLRKEHGAKR